MADDIRERIALPFAAMLQRISDHLGCEPDDLGADLFRAVENYGLHCFHLGDEYAHERTTAVDIQWGDDEVSTPALGHGLGRKR